MELKETNKPDYHHLISGDMSINTQCECVCNKGILKKQAFRCFKSFGLFSILLFFRNEYLKNIYNTIDKKYKSSIYLVYTIKGG